MSTENKKPENPYVYPSNELNGDGTIYQQFHGMTLRDYFASKAMSSTNGPSYYQGDDETDKSVKAFAKRCYIIADAMLKERENETDK